MTALPFALTVAKDGSWHGVWVTPKIDVLVAGDADAPDAGCLATLRALVGDWSATVARIAAYLRALPADTLVELEASSWGGFAAGDCGFDDELRFQSIVVKHAASPGRVSITFYTGLPDGYATYRIALDDGLPVALTAFAS